MKQSPFRLSRWIWPEYFSWNLHNSFALFRKSFDLPKIPGKAPLFVTADQSYRFYVNGRYVGRGPARGVQARWPYDEIDIRPFLKHGKNILAIRAYNPGRSNFQYRSEGFAGLLVAAHWDKIQIVSDASWKSIRQSGIDHDAVPSSMQLFDQEHIDLRAMPGDWTDLNFDDQSWGHPSERPWNAAPWFSLEPRGIPLLEERELAPERLLGMGAGKSGKGYRRVRDVVALRLGEARGHDPLKNNETFQPLLVKKTGQGHFRSYLFDFGRTVVGSLIFNFEGTQGGEIIDTHLAETVDEKTLTLDQLLRSHCRMAFGDRLVASAGSGGHRFHHHYGFRYLAVTVRDAKSDFNLRIALNWIGYPFEKKGLFNSSSAELNRIWEACAWTQQCCSLDAYVDTPWREQAQWWGDARVQAWNTFHLTGDSRLFRRGIAQIAGQTTPDGVTYGHAPTIAHDCVLPDFTIIWFLTLWDYYWQTGSTEPVNSHADTIRKALAYFKSQTDPKTGLIVYDDRYWLFLDWADIFKDGAPAVYNLWLLIALEKLALLHDEARHHREARSLKFWAKGLRKSLAKLIDTDGIMHDGICRQVEIVAETSIQSQTLALMAELKGLNQTRILETILLPYIRGETTPKATPSAYWITYVFSVLSSHGYGAEVVAFIQKHWAAMAEHGTTWENFVPLRGDTSHSHAWSAHPIYHLMQIMGGIRQAAPRWKEIIFRPVFIGKSCKVAVPTPHGVIRTQWVRRGTRIDVRLTLPPGIRATIKLPGVKSGTTVGSATWKLSNISDQTAFPVKV